MTQTEKMDKLLEDMTVLLEQQAYLIQQLEQYKPLLERYQRAVQANGFFETRRAMKGKV